MLWFKRLKVDLIYLLLGQESESGVSVGLMVAMRFLIVLAKGSTDDQAQKNVSFQRVCNRKKNLLEVSLQRTERSFTLSSPVLVEGAAELRLVVLIEVGFLQANAI